MLRMILQDLDLKTSIKAPVEMRSCDALKRLHEGSCSQRQLLLLRYFPDMAKAL